MQYSLVTTTQNVSVLVPSKVQRIRKFHKKLSPEISNHDNWLLAVEGLPIPRTSAIRLNKIA